MNEFEISDAKQRAEIAKESRADGRTKPPPKPRTNLIHIVREGDSSTLRKLQSHKVTKTMLDRLFATSVDHLEDQFGEIGASLRVIGPCPRVSKLRRRCDVHGCLHPRIWFM